jgi:hypothetical protein
MLRTVSCLLLVASLIGSVPAVADEAGVPASMPATVTASGPPQVAVLPQMLPAAEPAPHAVSRDSGYRGIWWAAGRPGPFLGHRLSGGLAFEPMDHAPVAFYAAAVEKTFFVYAGSSDVPVDEQGKQPLRIMIGEYNHKTAALAAPVILMDDLPLGARGCPALTVDDAGRLWVFVSIMGAEHPSTILRSAQPHQIDAWEKVAEMEFERPQVWHVSGRGFMLLHSRMVDEMPRVHFSTSPDGLSWSKPAILATFGEGQSCVSAKHNSKIGLVFNHRKPGQPIDGRSDLYYMETPDLGSTWQVYPRARVEVPLTSEDNPARLVEHKNWRSLLRDLAFDGMGNPLVLYVLRHQTRPMASARTRIWGTARWGGREWLHNGVLFSNSDHDGGCIEVDGLTWYATFPSIPDPQPNSAGGEIVRWRTDTQGRSWYRQRLTFDSPVNHNWVRRVLDARPDLMLLWADGHPRQPSASRLYFADQAGNVYRLPNIMHEDTASPELMWKAPEPQTQPEDDVEVQPAGAGPATTETR